MRGHPAVDEIIVFQKSRGWRALLDVRRAAAGQRFDLVLVLQVYIKAGLVTRCSAPSQARLRPRARPRHELALHHAAHPAARTAARAGSVLRIPRRARGPPRAGDLGSRPLAAGARAAEGTARRAGAARGVARRSVRATRRRSGSPSDGRSSAARSGSDFDLEPVLAGGRSERELATERVMTERLAPRAAVRAGGATARPRRPGSTGPRSWCRSTPGRCTWRSRSTGR